VVQIGSSITQVAGLELNLLYIVECINFIITFSFSRCITGLKYVEINTQYPLKTGNPLISYRNHLYTTNCLSCCGDIDHRSIDLPPQAALTRPPTSLLPQLDPILPNFPGSEVQLFWPSLRSAGSDADIFSSNRAVHQRR